MDGYEVASKELDKTVEGIVACQKRMVVDVCAECEYVKDCSRMAAYQKAMVEFVKQVKKLEDKV